MKTKPHKETPLFNINTNKINVKSTTEHLLHEVLLSLPSAPFSTPDVAKAIPFKHFQTTYAFEILGAMTLFRHHGNLVPGIC